MPIVLLFLFVGLVFCLTRGGSPEGIPDQEGLEDLDDYEYFVQRDRGDNVR